MATKKKRRPTYEELRRLYVLERQRTRMLARQKEEVQIANLALAVRNNKLSGENKALKEKIWSLEWSRIERGHIAWDLKQRGIRH